MLLGVRSTGYVFYNGFPQARCPLQPTGFTTDRYVTVYPRIFFPFPPLFLSYGFLIYLGLSRRPSHHVMMSSRLLSYSHLSPSPHIHCFCPALFLCFYFVPARSQDRTGRVDCFAWLVGQNFSMRLMPLTCFFNQLGYFCT
ncbi:hypothetical protein BDW71DRAFT_169515 [Aspergillus fruticulosus]